MKFEYKTHCTYNSMVKRFQNKISESRFLLATVAVITVLIWLAAGPLTPKTAINLAAIAVTAYFLVELDTRNSIIRIYSRMIPCSYLILSTMTGAFVNETYIFTGLLWTFFLLFLFSSYQDKYASGRVFYAFLFLGLASLMFVQILFFVPLIWFVMRTNLMSLSRKTFPASIIGFILPYWFLCGYLLMKGDLSYFVNHFLQLGVFCTPFDLSVLDIHEYITVGFLILLSLTGIIHYMRNSNKDKIRTRMFCEMIISTNLFVILFILLQPVNYFPLLAIMVMTTSVLISHYIVLTNTKLTNRSVYLIIATVAAVTTYNLWIS